MYTVTVTAIFQSRTTLPIQLDVKTRMGCFSGKELEDGINRMYKDVLALCPSNYGFVSACHTVTR